jgi:hypothetical protein
MELVRQIPANRYNNNIKFDSRFILNNTVIWKGQVGS